MLIAAMAAGLMACTSTGSPAAPPTGAAPRTSPAPSGTSTPSGSAAASGAPTNSSAATLDLSGTAKQNLAYFNQVGHALLDKNTAANSDGRAIVDYFVKAGFPKKDMEVTPDKTSIGLAAWNIEFSVKINGGCIIGQAGNVGFNSFVAPVVSTGTCLIGTTRKIDW